MLLNVCCSEELVIQCGAFALAHHKVPGIFITIDFVQSMQMPAKRKRAMISLCYCKNGFDLVDAQEGSWTFRGAQPYTENHCFI